MNVDRPTLPSTSYQESAARSGMYGLLGRLWLREIELGFLRELCAPPLHDSFTEAGGVLPPRADSETIEQLAVDYCQLFVGPANHLPPIQSIWQTGQFQSTMTTSVQTFIEIVDYPTDELPSGAMLDHLGVQLDVMAHILSHLTISSEEDQRRAVLQLAFAFFQMHLTWPNGLFEAAAARATTEFYRSTVTLTRDFLISETSAVNVIGNAR